MDAPGAFQVGSERSFANLFFNAALRADPRPTFVLEAAPPGSATSEASNLLFCNDALTGCATTWSSIQNTVLSTSQISNREALAFRRWLSSMRGSNTSSRVGVRYCDNYWTSYIVDGLFQVVSANESDRSPHHEGQALMAPQQSSGLSPAQRIIDKTSLVSHSEESKRKPKSVLKHSFQRNERQTAIDRRYDPKPPPSEEDAKVAIPPRLSTSMASDWTAENPHGVLSEHESFARDADWASTPLGPMSSWSAEFREVVNLLMRNPHPASLFWGQELTMIYNEPYSKEVAGKKHPGLMGSGFFGPFAELWESVRPIFQECAQTGKAIRKENDRLLIERYGYLEETFFSWSWTPLYGGTDRILGFYNAPFETTYQTVSSRRMGTLRELGERTAPARSVSHFWRSVLAGLEVNPYDIPFATIYSMTDSDSSETASISSSSTLSSKLCTLEGTIGVPQDHPVAPPKIDLGSKDEIALLFRDAANNREPVILRACDGSLPTMFLDGIAWRGFEIPSKEVLIIPIRSVDEINTSAILLLGLNPRRKFDDDYKSFIAMLNRQLTTSLASLLKMEDEKRRNHTAAELAALQREQLTQELALQTSRLRRMTEHSPLGMFLFSPEGVLLEANERYYEMTNMPREEIYEMSFLDTVTDSSKPIAMEMWRRMTVDHIPQSEEVQLQHNYNTEINEETGKPIDCWILGSCVPEIGQDGLVRSVMGSMTDISHMKWAQLLQDQRLREAEDTKRQQNAFIDITSHEMRNPMSAVLICADDIRESLVHPRFEDDEAVKECLEAVNTIILCVQHQKLIVDDILTISKLNSNLLVISPTATRPVEVVQQAIKMFRNEAQAKSIDLSLNLHSSLRDLEMECVMLDPGRLLQITINLITNAIKFTQQERKRFISIYVGASFIAPTPVTPGFEYVPTRGPQTDVTTSGEWGEGSLMYLRVTVADTGCGLTLEEKQRLFQRFSQASPRTHAQYGGSGLGLFISRQLAELHGGQIGVASEAGRGSTFGFFIQCRRTVDLKIQTPEKALAPGKDNSGFSHNMEVLAPAHGVPLADPVLMPSSFDPRGLYVLVVEDNLVNQKILRRQLEKVGCSVATADNGVLALQYLETTDLYTTGAAKLSVILMDLEMPEMDGLTCVTRIRDLEARGISQRRIPVIAVTANVRVEQLQSARDSGMDDIVSKPFRIPELLTRIEAVVRDNIL